MAIIFNVGLSDKDTHKQEITTQDAIQLIANLVGDCTIKTGNIGIFTHADGTRVIENSLEVVAYEMDKSTGEVIASELARQLNQELVCVTEQQLNTSFIGQ